MKKILLLATGLLVFGCETQRTETTRTTTTETNPDESVEIGAGTEISPQLEGIEDSASRLKVDPISAPRETDPR